MTNPLIDKYNELYNQKPPEPPPPVEKPKLFKTYDPDNLKESFIETAFKVKTGEAQVTSMSMDIDNMGIYSAGAKITFEVYVHKF
jgi:hypothetical protein